MKLSLLVSTYNQPTALAKVLAGLERQTRWPDEILIADDGSGAATRELIEGWRRKAGCSVEHIWHADEGFRKTVILNKAISAASGDYVVLLDGDCVPHKQFVTDHVGLAERGFWVQGRRCFVREPFVKEFEIGRTLELAWMLSGRITGALKGLRLPWALIRRNTGQRGIIGCNMAFWRSDVVAVNGFDEEYTGWGGEDSDLGTRLYHLGRKRKLVYGHAVVYHLNHPMLPRDRFPTSRARLQSVIESGIVRCERGLDQYLNSARPQ